jgi:3-oxoacyl-[acyl-carrier protein] reductase
MDMTGKVALVLGASAEGGTGWATAEMLAARGAKVVVSARRERPIRELADKIGGHGVVCDAGSEAQIEALVAETLATYGKIDLAVNCAFAQADGFIRNVDDAAMRASFDVNFFGHVYFIRHVAEAMNPGGAITLISSFAAHQPVYARAAYGAGKAAMDCLVRYAAIEYGPQGIRVNSILPGPIKTVAAAYLYEAPGMEEAFAREIPLGRVGEPDDFARIIIDLYHSGYITGVNLHASGGMHMNRVPRPEEMPGKLAQLE